MATPAPVLLFFKLGRVSFPFHLLCSYENGSWLTQNVSEKLQNYFSSAAMFRGDANEETFRETMFHSN